MSGSGGRDAVASRVPRGTLDCLQSYVDLLTDEATAQNLVSQSTLDSVWDRHVLDSLQLIDLVEGDGTWVDVGSGAGLPGLVVAIASGHQVTLIEPRKRRAEFLGRVVTSLSLPDVTIIPQRSESVRMKPVAIISARAVAALEQVFAMAAHFADRATQWVLPKGRSAAVEVAIARRTWQGEFRLVPSLTEPESSIVVARDIRRRGQA